jgi:molybdopterin-guanine dinucleotide biosynthesis protein A
MLTVSGLILAGGRGIRLGLPKATALLEGEPLILRPLRVLDEVCQEVIVAHGGQHVGRRLEGVVGDAILVSDEEVGPLGGLVAGLRAAKGRWVAVAPCDAPLLSVELYAELLSRARGHDAAIPRIAGREVPVVAVYRRETTLKAGIEALQAGERAMHQLLPRLRLCYVEEDALRSMPYGLDCLLDVDTAEDLERARRLLRSSR